MAIRTSPVGYSFTALRIFQCISICPIAALAGVLAAEVNHLDGSRQPTAVALALAVSVVTFAYAFTTFLTHVCGPRGHLVDAVLDGAAAVVMVVVAAYIGQPLTQLDCGAVGARNAHIKSLGDVLFSIGANQTGWEGRVEPYGRNMTGMRGEGHFGAVAGGARGLQSVGGLPALGITREEVREQMSDYRQWVGRVEDQCLAMKVAWGFGILLPFLFAATAVLAFIMWRRKYCIKTFHVETVDGEQVYSMHHERASSGVMSEVSLPETDPEGGIENPGHHLLDEAGKGGVSSDS